MEIEWNEVKRLTLWSYEDLIRKLEGVLAYGFVKEHYNHTMPQAREYAKKVRAGYLQDQGEMTDFIDEVIANLQTLDSLQVPTYEGLVARVATREQCAGFLERTSFDFPRLIQTLNYLLRWVLPFATPLRELVDANRPIEVEHLKALKEVGVRSNLGLIEAGRTRVARQGISRTARIPMAFVTGLVHRADISRLAFVRGKTVRHLCGGGYDTLEKIGGADPTQMERKMEAYYRSLGKTARDFKSVIPLWWMVGGAKILPRVVVD